MADGSYTVKVDTFGYWQATPYPTATIYPGGTQAVDCPVRRGGVVTGRVSFKEAGATISGGITGLVKVEAVNATGAKGVAFHSITSPATYLDYAVYGKYKYGVELDGGLLDGAYTIRFTLYPFTHLTQAITATGGGSAALNFAANKMGTIAGMVREAVTYQAERQYRCRGLRSP